MCTCLNAYSGSGLPLASHLTAKLSSKDKAIRVAGDCSVIIGGCSTEKREHKCGSYTTQ